MKLSHVAAATVFAAATTLAACGGDMQPLTSATGNANAASAKNAMPKVGKVDTFASPVAASVSASHAPAKVPSPRLGEEYKKIDSFVEFRKKLLADGWKPVANPDCQDVVLGDYHGEFCSANPNDIECRVCKMVPEIFRLTGDGYGVMHYIKDGVPLSVTVYGDIRDLDEPGRYGLDVVDWEYTTSINAILMN